MDLAQFHFGTMDYRFRTVFITITLFPRFQTDEGHTGVLCLAAEAKPLTEHFQRSLSRFQIVIRHFDPTLFASALASRQRALNHGQKDTLILFR